MLVSFSAARGDAPAPAEKKEESRAAVLRKLVYSTASFGPVDDPKTTLGEVLGLLADRYDVTIRINEAALKADGVDEPCKTLIAETVIPKLSQVTVDTVLREFLARVPARSGVTYLIRRDAIEITTVAAQRAEVWGKDHKGPFLPLVHVAYEKLPLELWLKDLIEITGCSIVLDPRVAENTKATVTATFTNVPLDTALRLLADAAGLKAVLLDNAFYVTTKDNARLLQEKEEERKLGRPELKKGEQGRPDGQPPGPGDGKPEK